MTTYRWSGVGSSAYSAANFSAGSCASRSSNRALTHLVQIEPLDRVDVRFPRRGVQRLARVSDSRFPALPDAGAAEVDVLGLVLTLQARRKKAHDVHSGQTTIAGHFADPRALTLRLREALGELGNNVAQTMDLFLPCDVRDGSARILDLLLSVHHLPDALRLGTLGVPDMHGEDERVSARKVVENRLDRRVRQDPAVPVQIILDAYGGESRWQRP